MKCFTIIFCVFLSVVTADNLPHKLITCEIEKFNVNYNLSPDHLECMKKTLKNTADVCDTNNFYDTLILSENNESVKNLLNQVEEVAGGAFSLCEMGDSVFPNEFFQGIKDNLTHDENLDCYRAELKRLKPELEIVKNFNKNLVCDSEEISKRLGINQEVAASNVVIYNKMKAPKCTLDEYHEVFYAISLQNIVMVKTSNLSFAEMGNALKDGIKKAYDIKLDCILNSWD